MTFIDRYGDKVYGWKRRKNGKNVCHLFGCKGLMKYIGEKIADFVEEKKLRSVWLCEKCGTEDWQ